MTTAKRYLLCAVLRDAYLACNVGTSTEANLASDARRISARLEVVPGSGNRPRVKSARGDRLKVGIRFQNSYLSCLLPKLRSLFAPHKLRGDRVYLSLSRSRNRASHIRRTQPL